MIIIESLEVLWAFLGTDLSQGQCKICDKILLVFRDTSPVELEYFRLGSHSTVMVLSSCESHKSFIMESLRLDPVLHKLKDYAILSGPGRKQFLATTRPAPHNEITNLNLRIVKDPLSAKPQSFIQPNASWIQRSLPRRWKALCDESHSGMCKSSFETISAVRPAWLIDTWMECLVPFSDQQSYVALSYVWGQVEQHRTLSSELDVLQRPYSLHRDSETTSLPDTIHDAIRWVQVLDERFLWVDSICIVDDDPSHKHAELDRMSGIYANASVTIVAAQGDDPTYGLRGLRGVTKPRSFQQRVYRIKNVQLAECSFPPHGHKANKWETRGWTFQEAVFSRRRLIFEADCIRWECGQARILEESEPGSQGEPAGFRTRPYQVKYEHILRESHPDVSGLGLLLSSYSVREFTYSEDVLRAFSGIAYALSRVYPGGFISGLPAGFIGTALLWRGSVSLTRRKASTREGQLRLPSWTWAGWEGQISSISWRAADMWTNHNPRDALESHVGGYEFTETTPLCRWRYKEKESDPGVDICDIWQEYKLKYLTEAERPCPPGWTRHRCSCPKVSGDAGIRNPDQLDPKWFFKHDMDPVRQFRFPLPIRRQATPSSMIYAPFISCRTRYASLHVAENIHLGVSLQLVTLRIRNEQWAGVLQPDEGTADVVLGPYRRQLVQLVEIAQGQRWYKPNVALPYYSKIHELDPEVRPKAGESYDFYHVMWVVFEGGIAYRKGLGEVSKAAWEAQDRQEIDLTLG